MYTLKARYGGDATFAPSVDPIAVAAKQNSTVPWFRDFTSTGAISSINVRADRPVRVTLHLRVDVKNAGGTPCQNSGAVVFICPTGTVNLFDGTNALNDFPNAQNLNAARRG
jgi:hypothetical protein